MAIMGSRFKNKTENFSPPRGFEERSPRTKSQCATNELTPFLPDGRAWKHPILSQVWMICIWQIFDFQTWIRVVKMLKVAIKQGRFWPVSIITKVFSLVLKLLNVFRKQQRNTVFHVPTHPLGWIFFLFYLKLITGYMLSTRIDCCVFWWVLGAWYRCCVPFYSIL